MRGIMGVHYVRNRGINVMQRQLSNLLVSASCFADEHATKPPLIDMILV
jgi:hypothetical protein